MKSTAANVSSTKIFTTSASCTFFHAALSFRILILFFFNFSSTWNRLLIFNFTSSIFIRSMVQKIEFLFLSPKILSCVLEAFLRAWYNFIFIIFLFIYFYCSVLLFTVGCWFKISRFPDFIQCFPDFQNFQGSQVRIHACPVRKVDFWKSSMIIKKQENWTIT